MNRRKIFRRSFIAFLSVIFLLNAAIAHAEVYIGEGSYIMSEGENLGVSKERAKADAMRNAAEKAGVYVKNYTRTKNLKLEEDIIETMTANILKLIEDPKFLPYEQLDNLEGLMIRVIVKVQIDDSDINRWLNKDDNEKSTLVSQMEALRKANEEQARQIAELKRQLADKPQDKEIITKKFEDEDKIFLSNQKVEEGWKLWSENDFNGAKNLFDEAVQLNPYNADAYFGRGSSYEDLSQCKQAIEDLSKAIQLNPNYTEAYYNRGLAHYKQQQYERAIQDYNKAIKLEPKFEMAYNNRGLAYDDLGQYERAIQDFNKAIQINPNYADAYSNHGLACIHLGQYERAIQDFNKAIKIDPNHVWAHNNRGAAYYCLGKYQQAIADETKAIQLNPNQATAYYIRGFCYQQLGEKVKAQADFKKAKELGYNG